MKYNIFTKNDFVGGITTFFTMAYIIVVNPAILSDGTGISYSGAMTATVLCAFTMTLLMGLYAKLPYAVAPGMGVNAFFTYSVIIGQGVPWKTALGIVFWAGILFLIVSFTELRNRIALAIPKNLRIAAACGIGIFLTFIGLKNLGLVMADPITFVKIGNITPKVLLGLSGLVLMLGLHMRKNPLAFLFGMTFVTVSATFIGWIHWPEQYFAMPDFYSTLGKLDIKSALTPALLPIMISILFTDLFDSISTFIGVSHATGLLTPTGEPKNLRQGLIVDAFATMTAGIFGTSSGTPYIESTAGIAAGGRSGKSSIITALCFIPCFFIAPLAALIPDYATAPVLIIVGAMMFGTIRDIQFESIDETFPAFITIVLIPLTFSITQGILWGFITQVICKVMAGKIKEINSVLWLLALISCGLIFLMP